MFACGEANPLIGKWQVQVKIGNEMLDSAMKNFAGEANQYTTFTNTEMIATRGNAEQRSKVTYKQVTKNTWSISPDDGKTWMQLEVKDDDTIILEAGMMKVTMKKVK